MKYSEILAEANKKPKVPSRVPKTLKEVYKAWGSIPKTHEEAVEMMHWFGKTFSKKLNKEVFEVTKKCIVESYAWGPFECDEGGITDAWWKKAFLDSAYDEEYIEETKLYAKANKMSVDKIRKIWSKVKENVDANNFIRMMDWITDEYDEPAIYYLYVKMPTSTNMDIGY